MAEYLCVCACVCRVYFTRPLTRPRPGEGHDAAAGVGAEVPLGDSGSFFGVDPGRGLAGSRGGSSFSFPRPLVLRSVAAAGHAVPQAVRGAPSRPASPARRLWSLDGRRSDGCEATRQV